MTVYPWLQEPIACSACKMEFRAVETEYPCRVCDSVFHKDCVLEMKDIHPSHIEAVEKANTSVGWSCPVCVRINLNVYTMYRKHYQICCITRFLRGTFLQYHLRHQKKCKRKNIPYRSFKWEVAKYVYLFRNKNVKIFIHRKLVPLVILNRRLKRCCIMWKGLF